MSSIPKISQAGMVFIVTAFGLLGYFTIVSPIGLTNLEVLGLIFAPAAAAAAMTIWSFRMPLSMADVLMLVFSLIYFGKADIVSWSFWIALIVIMALTGFARYTVS